MELIPKLSPSSVPGSECIPIACSKKLAQFLVSYLKKDPGLKASLPLFKLPGKTLAITEGHLTVPYINIHEGCWIKLESLQLMIDGDGEYVAWTLLESYYGLLREKIKSDDSSVMIPNHDAVEYIYQVLCIYNKRPIPDQSCTDKLFHELFQNRKLYQIIPSLMTTKVMLFPFYYHPH